MTELILTSSVLILALVLLRRLLRGRISLRLQYALWALAAVRLLAPVTFGSSPVSVLNAVPERSGRVYVQYTGDIGSTTPEPAAAVPSAPAASLAPSPRPSVSPGVRLTTSLPEESDLPANTTVFSLSDLLRPVWFTGIAVMAGWFLAVNLSFRRKLKNAVPAQVPDCPLPVYVTGAVPSPCMVGLFRPAVYVTPACLEDEARLSHVLAHELTHWRHRDSLWSLVRCLCLSIWWFNPLVWLAASLSRRDCELACDEGALAKLGEDQRTAYGRTLIGLMAVSASPTRLLQTATGMADRKKGLKERLTLIAKKPRMLAVTVVAVALAAAGLVACTFTGGEAPENDPAPEASPVSSTRPDHYARLSEALADIPEELAEQLVVFTEDQPPQTFTLEEGELLRAYCGAYYVFSSDLTQPMGWVASLYRCKETGFDVPTPKDAVFDCFATDGTWYYAICTPSAGPTIDRMEEQGQAAYDGAVAWLREAVLARDGMRPWDGRLGISTELVVSFNQTAVVERLLAAEEVVLAQAGGQGYSTPPTGWDCLLGDNMLRSFLMDYYSFSKVTNPDGYTLDGMDYSLSTADGTVCLYSFPDSNLAVWVMDGREIWCRASPVTGEIAPLSAMMADWYGQLERQWLSAHVTGLSDGELAQFLLGLSNSYYLSDAQRELGDRFLARPGDILALASGAQGSSPVLWGGDGADWFASLLIAEFSANRDGETRDALDALAGFADRDCGGIVGQLRAALSRADTEADAQAAYAALLSGDFSVLVPWLQNEYWTDFPFYWADLEYLTLDLDRDGISELITRHTGGPQGQNAVFHYAGGQVDCWRWDAMDGAEFAYPLADGTMVYEFRFGGVPAFASYSLFYYDSQGDQLSTVTLAVLEGDEKSWLIDDERVSEARFNAVFDEQITSRLTDPAAWMPVMPGSEED